MVETANAINNHGVLSMVFGSGPVVQGVLILLIILSIWSWAITISKIIQYRRAKAATDEFSQIFWETRNLGRLNDTARRLEQSPLSQLFLAGYREMSEVTKKTEGHSISRDQMERSLGLVERTLKRSEYLESTKLERGITFLASVASSAPFIGLFGTVWGIMNAFHGLTSAKSTTIQAVAPGISEALVATAIGLAAAIPAAVAYNYFSVWVRKFRESMDKFSAEFLNVARGYFIQ